MKVRVIKANCPTYWYADKIGKMFEVDEKECVNNGYYSFSNYDSVWFIDQDDCEMVGEEETKEDPPERIILSAVKWQGLIVCDPQPESRHCNICSAFRDASDDTGFLTSSGRFVDRVEAKKIALAVGQAEGRMYKLNSEDLW